MEKTDRLQLIKKLVAKREENKVKRKLKREKEDPGCYAQIEHTKKDIYDELVRLDSYAYSNRKYHF